MARCKGPGVERPEAFAIDHWLSAIGRCRWSGWDSNPRPPACKADALPAELPPRVSYGGTT